MWLDQRAGLNLLQLAGMWLGQIIRLRLDQATFRRWFFIGLLLLGADLALRGLF